MTGSMLLASLVVTGLLGSVHCAAMCSPFAVAAGRRGPLGSALYSSGRLTAYALLGGIAGAFGGGVHATLSGLAYGSSIIALLAGGGLVLLGVQALLSRQAGGLVPAAGLPGRLYLGLVPLIRACVGARGPGSVYTLGVLNGLLPCPVTAPVLIVALASGSAAAGSALMVALGLGTLPAMLLAGHAGASLAARAVGHVGDAGAGRLATARARYAPGVAMLMLGIVTAARPFLQAAPPGHLH